MLRARFGLKSLSSKPRLPIYSSNTRWFSSHRSPYEILGVSKDSTASEIKKLAKQYHPDTNKDSAAAKKFLEIQQAYEILSDSDKKRNFDEYGYEDSSAARTSGSNSGFSPNDIFRGAFSRFSGGNFGDIFGFHDFAHEALSLDVEVTVPLSFMDSVLGTKKTIQYRALDDCSNCKGSGVAKGNHMKKCGHCKGSGQELKSRGGFILYATCKSCSGSGQFNPDPCQSCSGRGSIEMKRTLEIEIPAGVTEEMTLGVAGSGCGKSGKKGDLILKFKIEKSERFTRRKNDIYSDHRVDLSTAILGGDIIVPTIHGDMVVKIPPGTQPGDLKRLIGQGIVNANTGEKGHHYLTIGVDIPKILSPHQTELFQEFADSMMESGQKKRNGTSTSSKDVFSLADRVLAIISSIKSAIKS